MSERYRVATKAERGALLNAFYLVAGYEREQAIKVLVVRRRESPVSPVRRRRRYGLEFQRALKVAWEAADYPCAERLQPLLPDLLPLLKRHGPLDPDAQTESRRLTASTSTVERNLAQLPRGLVARKLSQTKPGRLLRRQVPVVVGK